MNRDSARAERVEEIRKTISECLANAWQACKDKKDTYQYDRLHDDLRAEQYQAKKLWHLTDAALLKSENLQQAEIHFRKAFGKSDLAWLQKIKLLAAHKIFTDLYGRSYREAAQIILAIRPAVAKLANEKQIVQLRKHFEHSRPKDGLAREGWDCIWEDAPRDCHPIDFAFYCIVSIKLPG